MSNSFESNETFRVTLSNGGWVELKKYLNIFDQRRAEAAGVVLVKLDGEPTKTIDWSLYEIARSEIWITKWLMLDAKDESVALSLDAIKNLKVSIFEEISRAIFNRIVEIAEEKKVKNLPVKTLPSDSLDVQISS